MKLLVYGENTNDIKKLAEKADFEIADANPEMIASVGGDGTFMKSESEFPGVPKFILQKTQTSKKGHDIDPEEILKKITRKEFMIEEEIKIEARSTSSTKLGTSSSGQAEFLGKKVIGLNEVVVHNHDPRQAIRYQIFLNGKQIGKDIIGDGVVISTPFGSTGYYKSITGSFFETGIGIAFNNSTEQMDHIVLKENSEIIVKIIRGKAICYADNHPEEIELNDGDEISVRKSGQNAKIVKFI